MANTPQNIIGFETGDINEAGTITGAFVTVQSTIKRSGSYALRINPGTGNTSYYRVASPSLAGLTTAITSSQIYCSFYFYYTTKATSGNAAPIFATNTGSSANRMETRLTGDGTLAVYDASLNLQATGTTVLAVSTWYRIDVLSTAGASAAYELKINGSTELSGTMDQSANANFYAVFGKTSNPGNQAVDYYYDDVWIDSSDYAPPGYRIGIMKPASDDSTTWSGTYADIDEVPISTSDFISSNGISNATYNMQSLLSASIPVNISIHSVKAYTYSAEILPTSNTFSIGIRSGSTNSMTTNSNPNASAVEVSKIYTVDPNTTATWTTLGLQAAKLRVNEGTAGVTTMRVYAGYFIVAYTPSRTFNIT